MGGCRCVRGWGNVSRWINAVTGKDGGIVPYRSDLIREKIRVMFRVGSMRLRGKMGNRFASERLDWRKKQWDESGKRDSNSRPSAWEADALPTELLPH